MKYKSYFKNDDGTDKIENRMSRKQSRRIIFQYNRKLSKRS